MCDIEQNYKLITNKKENSIESNLKSKIKKLKNQLLHFSNDYEFLKFPPPPDHADYLEWKDQLYFFHYHD